MKRMDINNGNPLEKIIGFSRAVRVGQFIAVGGTAPVDDAGETVGVGDITTQTRQCLEIIKDALEKAGSGFHEVTRSRIMLTNIEDWREVVVVRAEYLKGNRPVDTIVQVDRFINPQWMIEIEVDAITTN